MHRKRSYRRKVACSAYKKVIYSDYQSEHLKRKHANNKTIGFTPVETKPDPKQTKLSFLTTRREEIEILPVDNNEGIEMINSHVCDSDGSNISASEILLDANRIQGVVQIEEHKQVPSCSLIASEVDELSEEEGTESVIQDDPFSRPSAEHSKTQNADKPTSSSSETPSTYPSLSTTDSSDLGEALNQPLLSNYCRKSFNNKESRDFNAELFKKFPWTTFSTTSKTIMCYP